MPSITPFLWFDTQAEEAMNFYASVFNRSKVLSVNRAQGKVMSVEFELEGQKFMALNAGPMYKFTEAVSFFVDCETQLEMTVPGKLTADGAAEPLRLVERQVRPVVADHSDSAGTVAERQGLRTGRPGDERDAADEQTGHRPAAARLRRSVRAPLLRRPLLIDRSEAIR